jgi:pimeloyl-ACP methyl ester carboxylesterase
VGLLVLYAVFTQPSDVVRVTGLPDSEIPLRRLLSQNLNPYSDESNVRIAIPLLASIAANVYEPDEAPIGNCDDANSGRLPTPDWERLNGWSTPAACNAARSGLHYEVWGRLGDDGRMYAIIAFRGTLPKQLAHWCANLREVVSPLCDPKSDQYLSIAPLIDEILSGLYDEWGPDRHVIVVGHSLGGGLAELAASSARINSVYSFNPSPVVSDDIATKLLRALSDDGEAKRYVKEYSERVECNYWANNEPTRNIVTFNRVIESKEILEPVRWLLERLKLRPTIVAGESVVEYRTSLLSGNPVAQHSMRELACAMRKALPNPVLVPTGRQRRASSAAMLARGTTPR